MLCLDERSIKSGEDYQYLNVEEYYAVEVGIFMYVSIQKEYNN